MGLKEQIASTAASAKVPAATVVPLRPAGAGGAGDADAKRALLDELDAIPAKAPPKQEQAGPSAAVAPGLDPLAGTVADDQVLHIINKNTFMSHAGDGVVRIWRESTNAETGAFTQTPMTALDLDAEMAVHGGVRRFDGSKWVRTKPGTAWLAWPQRRSYPAGIGLWPEGPPPGAYNLYRGFGVAPQQGDAGPMVRHINMLCGGNAEVREYLLSWLAFCVQRPGRRPEVAVVLRGGQGTGKGTLAKVMLRIHGAHGLHVTQAKHFVGAFNNHLRQALFLMADEAVWAGDKSAEGTLKGLITEPTLVIEGKHRDAVGGVPNRLSILMASNDRWVIPAGADERRYLVVDVPSDRAQDLGYFGPLHQWLDGPGCGIFLQYLLDRDISSFNPRAVPRTAALTAQKIEAMAVLDRWVLAALDTATGLAGGEWTDAPMIVRCSGAALAFSEYAGRFGARAGRQDARSIGRRLNEVFGCGPSAIRVESGDRGRAWQLPGIEEARARAAQVFGLDAYEWGQA